MRYTSTLKWTLGLSLFLTFTSCSKKDNSSDGESDGAPGAATGGLAVGSSLEGAYPDSLAISVFPEEIDSEITGAGTLAVGLVEAETKTKPLREKIADQKRFLSGQGDSCIPPALQNTMRISNENCYEFDQDMIYGSKGSNTNGTHDGKNSKGEACLVSFARSKVNDVVQLVEETTGFVAAAICQSTKDSPSTGLPSIGEDLDLKGALQKALGNRLAQVDSAVMTRLDDQEDRAVFKTRFQIKDQRNRTRTIEIVHSPAADGTNDTFSGRLSLEMEGDVGDGPSIDSKKRMMSIQYERAREGENNRIRYELKTARLASSLATNAFSDGILNLNVGTNQNGDYTGFTQSNDAASGIMYISFDMDPDTNVGTMSYWQNPGGNFTEPARGLVFNLNLKEDPTDAAKSVYQGCANSGASDYSIRQSIKESKTLKPDGFYHPFFNTNSQGGCGAITEGSDASRDFQERTCTAPNGGSEVSKWYVPKILDEIKANEFVKNQKGNLITRQCYMQNKDGLYVINDTTETAGYDLIRTTETNKIIAPPSHQLPPPPPVQ